MDINALYDHNYGHAYRAWIGYLHTGMRTLDQGHEEARLAYTDESAPNPVAIGIMHACEDFEDQK